MPKLKVIMATPRGFCAGVERAIDIVERALIKYGAPVYVRHEIVHNQRVVDELRKQGAIFVENLDDVPLGAPTIFSAHGVSRTVEEEAKRRNLHVVDATCPLVSKVHIEGRRYAAEDYDVVLIGHQDHVEVEGTLGQIPGRVHVVGNVEDVSQVDVLNPAKVSYVTQTTLSIIDTKDIIDALEARFPKIVGPDTKDICYATHNRQRAVLDIVGDIDLLMVIGARNSSNSNRLREIGESAGIPSILVSEAEEINEAWFDKVNTIGITAGASAPESIVEECIHRIRIFRELDIEHRRGIVENVQFKLPAELKVVERQREIEKAV